MKTTTCFLCRSDKLKMAIDLGFHPLADTFLKPGQLEESEIRYPLNVVSCQDCGHLMNGYIVPATARYQDSEYSYDSSNSPVSIAHFEEMAKQAIDIVGIAKDDLVVDIGSNVGTLLGKFHDNSSCSVIGVEPSKNIADIAENKVKTINGFFSKQAVEEIRKTAKAKLITGTNVYNHIEDQTTFAKNIDSLLDSEGSAMFEMPYAGTLVDETSFDTIYLEHASYFFVSPLKKFWSDHGFTIHHIELNSYMGGSMRVYIARHLPESKAVAEMIRGEEAKGYFELKAYEDFMKRVVSLKMDLMKKLYDLKSNGKVVIGIGAATKGNTLLNYCGIDASILDYVTDASPLKIGKYTPGSHIPIKDDKDIDSTIVSHGVILPWNIGEFLSKKLSPLGLEFIVPHITED